MGSRTRIQSEGYTLNMNDENVKELNLVYCKTCGRHFAADRIETHEWICQKQKKRKPFDVSQQRVRGTDAEKFLKKGKTRPKPEVKKGLNYFILLIFKKNIIKPWHLLTKYNYFLETNPPSTSKKLA